MPARTVLGIFGQKPELGKVKARLADAYGPVFTAHLCDAMLFDVLDVWSSDRFAAGEGRRVLVYAPDDAGPWFDERVPASFALQPQTAGDLGARLHAFFEGEIEDGAERVIITTADCPTLDPSIVITAFLCLEGRDVVLGPATDGGYYLVGCRSRVPPIFGGIDWTSPAVLNQTIDRLRDTGLSLAVLPPWYRVDQPQDWETLRGHIRALRRAGVDPGLPRLEALIDVTVPDSGCRPPSSSE
jgi:rSAM/selenodomain-associated transferase 1